MELYNLLSNGVNVTLAITLEDLKNFHSLVLEDAKRNLEQVILEGKNETYLSPDKVCEMLSVDRSTLWRWNKRSYLNTIEVGGKRRYKLSDIKKLLNE